MSWTWAPAMPFRGWITSTSRCNLRCNTCYSHGPGQPDDDSKFEDMRPEVYERVRREILPGLQEICLSGVGEPFMASVFYQLLDDMLVDNKRVAVVTNGTILRPEYIERLVRSPSVIMVSIDATTADVMERMRPGARFDRVMEFMRTVKALADRSKHPGFEFQLSFVVTRSNLEQMSDCVEMCHRFGGTLVYFPSFVVDGRTDEFARTESLRDKPEIVMPHWQRAHQRGLEMGVTVLPMIFDCKDRSEEEWRRHKSDLYDGDRIRQCPLPWWSVFIEVDGTIKPCCAFNPPLGNLLERPFREIWNGPMFRALRQKVNTPTMPEACKHCFIQERF